MEGRREEERRGGRKRETEGEREGEEGRKGRRGQKRKEEREKGRGSRTKMISSMGRKENGGRERGGGEGHELLATTLM